MMVSKGRAAESRPNGRIVNFHSQHEQPYSQFAVAKSQAVSSCA